MGNYDAESSGVQQTPKGGGLIIPGSDDGRGSSRFGRAQELRDSSQTQWRVLGIDRQPVEAPPRP